MDDSKLDTDRQRIEQDQFFATLEDIGFFDAVSTHLPAEFTAIYEIARVLESLETPLGITLAPALLLNTAEQQDDTPPIPPEQNIPTLLPGEEYDADLLRNIQELPAIYPYQFLLPENVFYQRLVERTLWLPRPRPPQNYRYQSESDTFRPDHRKQKVYILFDISKSMNLHWRVHLAKAIAYVFLKNNMRELGTVYMRTFAEVVNPLQIANDIPSFNELISSIMHTQALGKGTVLQKALMQAIEDVQSLHALTDAEILVITDGAAHIEVAKLQEMMGTTIRVNTVKIGNDKIIADNKFVQYHLNDANTEDAKRLKILHNKRRDVALQLENASSEIRKNTVRNELSLLDKQITMVTDRVAQYISDHYGNEIAELSSVYVNVDDISPETFLSITSERRKELEILADALLNEIHNERRSDDIKRAAMLYEHLQLLLNHNSSEDFEQLEKKKNEIKEILQRVIQTDGDDDIDDIHLSSFDTKQLMNMLEPSMNNNPLALARIIRLLLRKTKNFLLNRRQVRKARILLKRRKRLY